MQFAVRYEIINSYVSARRLTRQPMNKAILTISSKNYSSWSLRGWLLCRFAKLEFDEELRTSDDPSTRAELMLMSPSFLVPSLRHGDIRVWDTLAIAEYLYESIPAPQLYPTDCKARAHCRSVSGEMHLGFANLRSALPVNLKARHSSYKIWAGAQPDIDRVQDIWRECLKTYDGPYLFGVGPTVADAMYAPVCTRFLTYGVKVDRFARDYCDTIMNLPEMLEWTEAARAEPDIVEELDSEF